MANKTLILCVSAMLSLAAKAQNTYFATGFDEGIPSSFTLHDNDGRTPSTDMQKLGFAVGTPWITTEEGDEGNKVACSTSWYKNAGQSDDWMVTGAIAVESDKATLEWRSRASDKDYRDGFSVYISEKGTDISDFDKAAPALRVTKETFEWTKHSISLAEYKGKTIYVAFVNDSKDKTCLYLDDLFAGVPSSVGIKALDRVSRLYGDVPVNAIVSATGDKAINGFTVGLRYGSTTSEQHFDQTLKPGEETSVALDAKMAIQRNATVPYELWIKAEGDSTGVSGKVSAYPWKIVVEEVTGTWCGYCVGGLATMKTMNEKHPDTFVGIALHNSTPTWPDAMAAGVEDYHDALFSRMGFSGYPNCVLNRNSMFNVNPTQMETYHNAILNSMKNNCGVQLQASYNAQTGMIEASTDIYFTENVDGSKYGLAYVLIENNVHRTHEELGIPENQASGYDQNNYYAGGGYGPMGGFENLPSTVPAEQMWYDDVARKIYPDFDGYRSVLPEDAKEGEKYTDSRSLDIPSNVLERENVELAVLLLDKNGIVANADKVAIDGLTTGIAGVTATFPDHDGACYNLSGMRISKPTKGIYISGGKKIAVGK